MTMNGFNENIYNEKMKLKHAPIQFAYQICERACVKPRY